MTGRDGADFDAWLADEDQRALWRVGITDQNGALLRRYRDFRGAADAVARAWRERSEVVAVALIGSLAVAPWKEVPRFSPYRRRRIALWHECRDVDLAVWLDDLSDLDGLRRAKDRALRAFQGELGGGVATHQVDIFVLEPGTSRYLGRLCGFNRCPKGKRESLAPGCGAVPFLQQHQGFRWRPDSLAEGRALVLYDRASGRSASAVDLPLPSEGGGAARRSA